jgi:hypothetical protein
MGVSNGDSADGDWPISSRWSGRRTPWLRRATKASDEPVIYASGRGPDQPRAVFRLLRPAGTRRPLWKGAEGWFDADRFAVGPLPPWTDREPSLANLVAAIAKADLAQLDESDETASPLRLNGAFGLRLDWWRERGASSMKLWAGRMNSTRIARAMQNALVGDAGGSGRPS